MLDRTVKKPVGILHDDLVKFDVFIFPTDYVILECEVEFKVLIILGQPFLPTGRGLVDMEKGKMKFILNNKEITFKICQSMQHPGDVKVVSVLHLPEEEKLDVPIKERLGIEALEAVIIKFVEEHITEYEVMVSALCSMGTYTYAPRNLHMDLKNRVTPPAKPSIVKHPVLELKALPLTYGMSSWAPTILCE